MSVPFGARILEGSITVDPSIAPGVVADVGDVIIRNGTAEVWQKFGALDTDWKLVGIVLASTNPTTIAPDDTAAPGVGTTAARADHRHAITTDAAVTITDSTNAEGAAATFARSDHTHSHGSRGGGTLHADVVSGGASGFMTGTDKALLDTLVATSTAGIFGTGIDGDVVMGAGTTTLTRDTFYHDLTVPNGATLNTDGFRVFVSGTLTIGATGVITSTPNSSANQTGAVQTTGNNLGLGGAGGNGGTAGGSNGAAGGALHPQPVPTAGATSGKGGVGGTATAGGAGGNGGAVNNAPDTVSLPWILPWFTRGQFPGTNAALGGYVAGGTGGGGGGGNGAGASGGGGGSGGRVIVIAARAIVNGGSITAPGGNGGPGQSSNAGGGAGGGGGTIFVVYRTLSGAGTITAPGGNGGAPSGTGAIGGTGSTGFVATLQV